MNPESLYYDMLNPMHHLTLALLAVHGQVPADAINFGTNDMDENLARDFETTRSTHVHFIRHQQAETMLLLVLAAASQQPVPRLSKKLQNKFRSCCREISQRIVPNSLQTNSSQENVNFKDWVVGAISGGHDLCIEDSVVDFIVEEADFFTKYNHYASFKHGTMISSNPILMSLKMEDGKDVPFRMRTAVSYMNWNSGKGSAESKEGFLFGTVEINRDYDLSRIAVSAMIVNMIKQIKTKSKKISLVTVFKFANFHPQHFEVNVTYK